MANYIASISYGKDSLAMLEVIKEKGMPLDRIVHVELMATKNIPADLPEVTRWKKYADNIIKQRYALEVEHVKGEATFEDWFYTVPKRTNKNMHLQGTFKGWPSLQSQWCSQHLKVRVMRALFSDENVVQYIGIASDEPKRFSQLDGKIRSPLAEHGVTEEEAHRICERIGLLAPLYVNSKRSGCWFCVAQPVKQLRLVRRNYPHLWELMLKWDKDSPIPFRHGGNEGTRTLGDYEDRFGLEDKGVLRENDKTFRWKKCEQLLKKGGMTPSPPVMP